MPLTIVAQPAQIVRLALDACTEFILSWNAVGPVDLDVRVECRNGHRTEWLPAVRRDPLRSCTSREAVVRIETDIVRSDIPMVSVDVRTSGIAALFLATPWREYALSPMARALTRVALPSVLDVPTKSQHINEQRGWCSPASLAMLLGYWAQRESHRAWDLDVACVAEKIFDPEYGGTGNWAFATAFAANLGLRGVVTYLQNLDHAQRLLTAQIPCALAIAWEAGDLTGAPLERSDGHLLVLRGFDRAGRALVNDPALPDISSSYEREELEQVWLRAGGVAYVVAPPAYDGKLLPILTHAA